MRTLPVCSGLVQVGMVTLVGITGIIGARSYAVREVNLLKNKQ